MNDISSRPYKTLMTDPAERRPGPHIDYSFLVALAGTGLLAGLACYLLGIGFGRPGAGIFLAALSVLVTVGIMIFVLKQHMAVADEDGFSAQAGDLPSATAYLLTSRKGEVIYCNSSYRRLVKKLTGGRIVSPLAMGFADKADRVELETMTLGMAPGEHCVLAADILGDDGKPHSLTLSLEHEKDRRGYIRWMITREEDGRKSPFAGRERGFDLEGLGAVLDQGGRGLLALDGRQDVVFVNATLRDWLEPLDRGALALPVPLSDLIGPVGRDMPEQIMLSSREDQNISLQFQPVEELPEACAGQDTALYVVMKSRAGGTASAYAGTDDVRIERFFMDSPIGIALVTEQGEVLERNNIFKTFLKDLGLGKGRKLEDFVEGEDYRDILGKVDHTISTGAANTVADVNFKGDGDKRGQLYITRLDKFSGHDAVAILYLIDTTEQKSLELQFAQSQKMQAVGQLAGGVAHDFNNLLTAITGFCDLLLVRHGPGDQSFSDIIQIKQNANRAANLVRQLLAFSRQQTLRPKVLLITDVLAELSNLLRRLIGENIELDMKHGRDLGLVKVDQGQLEQVIINLCVNARDAMADGGRIMIRTRNIPYKESEKISQRYKLMPPNDYVLLEVEDTGTGIPREHLGKIFEPFFSTKEVGKGTGLGLSTVYGIVKQTDGFIFPTSELGRGTVFSIYLPIHRETGQQQEPVEVMEDTAAKAARDLTGKGNILLVEDEDAVRMFASRALKNKGYRVFEASGGDKALQLVQELDGKLDLVISDVVMPQMDGPTLVRKIRDSNPDLKVIFISGYAEDAFDKSMGAEDFNFLPKPFSLKQLAEQVKMVLDA